MKLASKAVLGIIATVVGAGLFIVFVVQPALRASTAQVDLSAQAQIAVDVYETGGVDAYRRWQRRFSRRERVVGVLLQGDDYQQIGRLSPAMPPELRREIKQNIQTQRLPKQHEALSDGWWWQAYSVSTEQQRYTWLAIQPTSRQNRQLMFFLSLAVLAVFLIAAAILAAWSIVRPIRRLAATQRAFGEGNLQKRADPKIIQRKDELSDLAKSFDQAAEQVEKLLTSHKQLLYDVSHEIRSPLARMQVATELLRSADSTSQREKRLQQIETESENLNELVEQLLTQARLNQLQTAELTPINIVAVVKNQIDLWQNQAQQKQLMLSFEYSAAPVLASLVLPSLVLPSNEMLLKRILDNLLSNAIKFSRAGQTITVKLTESNDKIELIIEDQAGGVSPEALTKLTDAFYRTEQHNRNGLGLGLHICQKSSQLINAKLKFSNGRKGLQVALIWQR